MYKPVPVPVPTGVVTLTSLLPAVPTSGVAVICKSLSTVKLCTAAPIETAVAPRKLVPVIVTGTPPDSGPYAGFIPVTVGVVSYVYRPMPTPVPPGVTTLTFAGPAVPAPVSAVIVVLFTTLKLVTAPPTDTAVAPRNPVPVMVTEVSPPMLPYTGVILVTVGGGKYVYNWFGRLVPSGATTTTLALPSVPAGAVATICVAVALVIGAFTPPTFTADAPANPVPVSVNTVPPASGPVAGVTLETYNGFVTRFSLALVTYQLAPSLKKLAKSPCIIITLLATLVEFWFTIDGETAPEALAMFFTQS